MNICVVGGGGYVGLITGLGFAEMGHSVVNVDVDESRVATLQGGDSPIYEEGVAEVLRRNQQTGRISFTTDLQQAASSSQVIFIAVGTPSLADGAADLSQVIQVAEKLQAHLDSYKVIVVKSTVPVGTVELIRDILSRNKTEGQDFDIVVNPEFLREGKGLYDFFYPDRIVIGACSNRGVAVMRELYQPIVEGEFECQDIEPRQSRSVPVPVVETDPASAQMIKYASNAFLASRISFMNEIAALCEVVGSDVLEVSRGMGYDLRIGHAYLQAGLGFGGPCLEKDLRALMKLGEGNGHEPQLLGAILKQNEKQVGKVLSKLKHLVGPLLYRKNIAVFGLAFKAGTNDLRNSIALKVVDQLGQEGAVVRAHDPQAIPEARAFSPALSYHDDPYTAVEGTDALLVLTEWPSFRDLDYEAIKESMTHPFIVDARNLLDSKSLRALGFTCVGIGRP